MVKKLLTKTLEECCMDQAGISADPNDSVLVRVKIGGFESKNRRRYTREAFEEAAALYEGAKVNIDHPEGNPGASRGLRDRFGKLEGFTVEETGPYANLRYNPAHPMAAQVKWWAEHDPSQLGLSHNAVGQGRDEEGVFVVERIVSVRSVDLVADPATTKGLYESVQPMKIKLKSFFESAKWEAKMAPKIQKALKWLYEGDYMDPEMEMDGEAGCDHEQALKDGFDASCYAVIDDESMSAEEKVKRLRKLLKAHEKLKGGEDAPAEEEPTEEGDGDENGGGKDEDREEYEESIQVRAKKDPAFKALVEEVDALKTEKKLAERRATADRLIKEAKLPDAAVTEVFMESLLSAKDEKDMKRIVEDRRQLVGTRRPTSAAGSGGSASTLTPEEFRKQVKGRR